MPRGLATSPNAGCNGPTTSDHLPDKGGPISFIQNAAKQPHAACLFGRLQDLSSLPATRPNSRILVPARRPGGLFQHPGNTAKLAYPCARSAARRSFSASRQHGQTRTSLCPLGGPAARRPPCSRQCRSSLSARSVRLSACSSDPSLVRPSARPPVRALTLCLHAPSSSDLLCMPPLLPTFSARPVHAVMSARTALILPAPFGAFHGFFYPHGCFHGIEGNGPDVSVFVLFVARCNIKNPPDAPGLPLHVSRKHTNLCQSSVGLCTFSYFAGRFFLRLIRIAYLCLT